MGDARLRPDDLRRRPLRRPHHRPARRLLAGLEEDPRRYRPVLDQQERQGRSADRRRLRHVLDDMLRAWRDAAPSPTRRRSTSGGRDRQMADEEVARLSQLQQNHQAAICDPAALRADQGPRHLHHHRSRPASDVGGAVLSLPGAVPLDDLGRPRHHGLRAAGRGRRAARASRTRWSSTSPAKPRCR